MLFLDFSEGKELQPMACTYIHCDFMFQMQKRRMEVYKQSTHILNRQVQLLLELGFTLGQITQFILVFITIFILITHTIAETADHVNKVG